MTTPSPIARLQDVHYVYPDGTAALRGVDLDIHPREKLVIVGANGSGKSTLLKILDGLLFPSSGTLLYRSEPLLEAALRDPAFNARFRSSVGLVFQNADAQLFCPTVEEEIAFGPSQLGLSGAALEARVRETLALFRLGAVATRAPHHLSGGEKKRVALAAVLAVEPDLLLLDEPTAALDPRSKWELVDLLLALHRRGKTLVTATHDMEIVEALAERLVVLGENQQVLRSGEVRRLLQDTALLEEANLIHSHTHRHEGREHRHFHAAPGHHSTD